jgi:hypothetical protein
MDSKEKQAEEMVPLIKRSAEYRGQIIERVVVLERIIDTFIGMYFFKDMAKYREMQEMVFATTKITFLNKAEVLTAIIKKNNSQFLVKNKKFFDELNGIAEERNKFAHHATDISKKAVEVFKKDGTVVLLKYKNEEIPSPYNDEIIDNLMTKITKYQKLILSIIPAPIEQSTLVTITS